MAPLFKGHTEISNKQMILVVHFKNNNNCGHVTIFGRLRLQQSYKWPNKVPPASVPTKPLFCKPHI